MGALEYIALYVIVGAITGGYIRGMKEGTYPTFDAFDTFLVSIGWPLTLVWYGALKPTVKLGGWLAHKHQELIQSRRQAKLVREREREIQERDQRLRIAEGMQDVEKFMVSEEDSHHEPKRMRG